MERVGNGLSTRADPKKDYALTASYHRNVSGYTGYKPLDVKNDHGPIQVWKFRSFGRSLFVSLFFFFFCNRLEDIVPYILQTKKFDFTIDG